MIIIREAIPSDIEFMISCIKHSHEINDKPDPYDSINDGLHHIKEYREAEFYSIRQYLESNQVFIVHKGNRDIGFFTQDIDDLNSHIGATAWLHPHSCKMSIVPLIQACTLRGVMYGFKHSYTYVELNTWHPLIVRTVLNICPELREYKLYDTYRIIFGKYYDMKSGKTFENMKKFKYYDMDEDKLTFGFDI